MTARRHVVIVVENLTVPVDRRVWLEARTLHDAGFEVTVICPMGAGYEDPEEVLEGIRILRHPVPADTGSRLAFVWEYAHALWWERRLLRRVWKEHRFDVVHLCNPPDLLFMVALPYRRHGVKVVFDQHDPSPEVYESKFGRRGVLYALLRLFERLTFRTADRVISNNESHRRLAIERGGVSPRAVTVVRNGPDLEEFTPRPPDPAVRRGRDHLVVWLGHLEEQSGVQDLVRAAAHLAGRGRRDIAFLVIGDGGARASVEALARELGVSESIEFTGPLYGDDLIRHVSSGDLGLVTMRRSGRGEMTTAVKTMEYMALGLPVLQYDLTEARRTAEETAAYARPDDPEDLGEKIAWLMDRPEERERLARLGRERVVETLAWRHQAPKLLAAYRALLSAG